MNCSERQVSPVQCFAPLEGLVTSLPEVTREGAADQRPRCIVRTANLDAADLPLHIISSRIQVPPKRAAMLVWSTSCRVRPQKLANSKTASGRTTVHGISHRPCSCLCLIRIRPACNPSTKMQLLCACATGVQAPQSTLFANVSR